MLRQIQVLKDLADDAPLFNEGNDLHLISAARTSQGIDLVDLLDPVQSIQAARDTLVRAVLDLSGFGPLEESSPSETGAQDIGGQSFQSRLIVSINRRPAVHLKARRVPAAEPIGELPAETALRGQQLQDVVLEQPREPLRVQRAEGLKLLLPIPDADADQRVQVGMEIELVSVGLDGDDGPGSGGPVERLGLGAVLQKR